MNNKIILKGEIRTIYHSTNYYFKTAKEHFKAINSIWDSEEFLNCSEYDKGFLKGYEDAFNVKHMTNNLVFENNIYVYKMDKTKVWG